MLDAARCRVDGTEWLLLLEDVWMDQWMDGGLPYTRIISLRLLLAISLVLIDKTDGMKDGLVLYLRAWPVFVGCC